MSFNVLISDPLSEEGVHPLKEADNLNITKKTDLTKDELLKEIGNYDELLVRRKTQVTREVIDLSNKLSNKKERVNPKNKEKNINITKKTYITKEYLLKEIGNYDALLVRSQTQVTREVIEQAHNLKVIARAGVGVDNIDLDAATEN